MFFIENKIINKYYLGRRLNVISANFKIDIDQIKVIIIKERINKLMLIANFEKIENENIKLELFIKETIEKIDKIEEDERRLQIINIIKLIDSGVTYRNISTIINLSTQRISQLMLRYADEYSVIRTVKTINICHKCGKKDKYIYKYIDDKYWCQKCIKAERKKKKKKWSRKFDKCQDCGTTKIKHVSHGRCEKCVRKFLYNYDLKRKEALKQSNKKWRKSNKDKIKKIAIKASEKIREKKFGGNRKKVLERDNYKCRICGCKKNDTILNVTRIEKKDGYTINNLITLCSKCHFKYVRGVMPSNIMEKATKEIKHNLASQYLSYTKYKNNKDIN
jgi:5-methylcytosine-specific restriction endonuclease McrA